MMHHLLGRIIEVLIGFIIIKYISFYLFTFIFPSNFWLILVVGSWLTIGHILKKRLSYQGLLSNWYAPLIVLNETLLSYFFVLLTIYILVKNKLYFSVDLALTLTLSAIVLVFINYIFKKSKISPLLKTIILFSAIQIYFIQTNFFQEIYLKNGSLFYNIIIEIIILSVLSYINYLNMRNFVFYQKLIIKKNKDSYSNYNQKLNIAVHEASHLLFYTYFKTLPKDINIFLFSKAKKISQDAEGIVIARVPIHNTKEFLIWRMMLSISGIRGELLIFNAHSHGSESDFQQWRELATIYLINFDGRYISQPISTTDFNNNKLIETELYGEQIEIIDRFLKENKNLLMKVAKKTLVLNKLNYHQIYPFMKQIKCTKGIPKEK